MKRPGRTPRNKYSLSKFRYRELHYMCLQYKDYLAELRNCNDTVKSMTVSDMPTSRSNSDVTSDLAIRRADIQRKVEAIEQSAIKADSEIYQYIIEDVTNDYVSYEYLANVKGMPTSRGNYYDKRRKFYYLLDKVV